MVGRFDDAEDLLQEIFMLAFDRLETYEGRSALGTWLHRLAMNRCLDFLKSRPTRDRARTESLDGDMGSRAALPGEPLSASMDLENAFARLPHSYRAAFVLHDVQGLGHREVAEILGVAEVRQGRDRSLGLAGRWGRDQQRER